MCVSVCDPVTTYFPSYISDSESCPPPPPSPFLLQKLVSHQESQEHSLYSQAREAEAQRKRQDQVVGKLQVELETLKRTNAKRLKVCVFVCLSVWLSVWLSVCLSVWLSVCLPICLPVCLSYCLLGYLPACLLPPCLSVFCLSVSAGCFYYECT